MFSKVILNSKKRVQSISRAQALVSFAALTMLLSPISAYGMDPDRDENNTGYAQLTHTVNPTAEDWSRFDWMKDFANKWLIGPDYVEHLGDRENFEFVESMAENLYHLGCCYRYASDYRVILPWCPINVKDFNEAKYYFEKAAALNNHNDLGVKYKYASRAKSELNRLKLDILIENGQANFYSGPEDDQSSGE